MLDSAALADLIAELIGEHVERATGPLVARIAELERRAVPTDVAGMVAATVADQLPAALIDLKGEPGVGIQAVEIVDGRLVFTFSDDAKRDVGQVVGQPGVDVDIASVKATVQEVVETCDIGGAVAAAVSAAIDRLPKAKDGLGLSGALIDRTGNLVLTLTDGSHSNLGQVVGRDVDMHQVEQLVAASVDAIPKPKDGKDGFSLDDFAVRPADDGRTVTLSFTRGQIVQEFDLTFPVPIYRGVWREKDDAGAPAQYVAGDMVTWGGSLWHCDEKTSDKPGAGPWRLAAKKGRDAREPAR